MSAGKLDPRTGLRPLRPVERRAAQVWVPHSTVWDLKRRLRSFGSFFLLRGGR